MTAMFRVNFQAAAASLALAIALVGCETTSTRNCPAFEGHPDLSAWAPYVVGDRLMYASDQGRTENYTLRSIVGSEAYEDTDFGDPEDIRCRATASYLFESSSGDHYLSQVYDIVDIVGEEPEHPLYIVIAAVGSPDERPPSTALFRFLLSDPADTAAGNNSTAEFEVTYSPIREIGQITYQEVLEARARELVIDLSTPAETTLTRVVFARNAGLVEFERSDNQTFTLLPP